MKGTGNSGRPGEMAGPGNHGNIKPGEAAGPDNDGKQTGVKEVGNDERNW